MATNVGNVQVETCGEGHNIVWAANEKYTLRKLAPLDQELAGATPMTEVAVSQNWQGRRTAVLAEGLSEVMFDQMVEKSVGCFGQYLMTDHDEENCIGLIEIYSPEEDRHYKKRQEAGQALGYDAETIYFRSRSTTVLDIELFRDWSGPDYFREALKLALATVDHFKGLGVEPTFREVIYLISDREGSWNDFGKSRILEENGLVPIESYLIPINGEQTISHVHQKMFRA